MNEHPSKLEKGAIVDHFCRECGEVRKMRYEGPTSPVAETDPNYERFKGVYMYSCLTCERSDSFKEDQNP